MHFAPIDAMLNLVKVALLAFPDAPPDLQVDRRYVDRLHGAAREQASSPRLSAIGIETRSLLNHPFVFAQSSVSFGGCFALLFSCFGRD